ncbi:unknown protein [Leptolyngbya sp. NIES-3755]|nr:unknown protein [Leptolyngbya sp. NIES-3755]
MSYLGAQRSLRWWYRQHSIRLHNEAEAIRNDLLQRLFVMRRSLESGQPEAIQQSITQVEHLYQSLYGLSDRLSAFDLEDDLGMALHHLIEAWRKRELNLTAELPKTAIHLPIEQHRLTLVATDEFLRIAAANLLTPQVIFVSLSFNSHTYELKAKVDDPQVNKLQGSDDLKHLTQALRFLSGGQCSCYSHDDTLTWQFRSTVTKSQPAKF